MARSPSHRFDGRVCGAMYCPIFTFLGPVAPASAATAAPGSDDEDGDAQGLEERDIHMPVLGDLAALSVGPFVCVP